MKFIVRGRVLLFFLSTISFVLPAIASPLTQKEKTVIDTLFAKTKPQCIGRYIIDVPESFNNQLFDMVFIDDFKIQSRFLYPPAFKQRIQLRERELNDAIDKPGNYSRNTPFIKEKVTLPEGKGVIFDRNIPGSDDLGRVLEAHVYVNMIAFIITAEILDLSHPKYVERKSNYAKAGFTEAQMNEKPAKLAAMQSLITRLSGRNDHDIPQGKGVCIPNGFIKDDAGKHKEVLTFRYENDDFIFGAEMDNTISGSDDTLFNRSDEINEALKSSSLYTIKKEALSPDGIASEMWLFGGKQIIQDSITKENEENTFYDFDFYANERDATPEKPNLNIGMTSKYKKTRYSETEMIEIWDRLVRSLRYKK